MLNVVVNEKCNQDKDQNSVRDEERSMKEEEYESKKKAAMTGWVCDWVLLRFEAWKVAQATLESHRFYDYVAGGGL